MPDEKKAQKKQEKEDIKKLLDTLDLDTSMGLAPPEEIPPEPEAAAPVVPAAPAGEGAPPAEEKRITSELSFLDEIGKQILSGPEEKAEAPPAPGPEPVSMPVVPGEAVPPVEAAVPFPAEEEAPPREEGGPEKGGIKGPDLSDEQVITIHKKVLTFPPRLRKIVSQIIIRESLPREDMMVLFDYLLLDEKESIIRTFLENKLNTRITEKAKRREEETPYGRPTLRPSLVDIIRHDFIPILRLAIPLLAFLVFLAFIVIKPVWDRSRAAGMVRQGARLIRTDREAAFRDAEEKLQKALTIKKDYFTAYLEYGDAYLDVKKYVKSEQKYREFLRRRPSDIQGYLKLGNLFESQKLEDEAVEEYRKVLKFSKNNIQALDRIARIYYYTKNDREQALRIYSQMIEKDPRNVYAHYGKLSIHIWNKDLENVERQHLQVLKHGREKYYDLKRLTELAQFYIDYEAATRAQKTEHLNKAEDTLQRVLEQNKKYSEAYFQYARLYRVRQDFSRSRLNIERAIHHNPRAKYYNFLGEIYLIQNKLNLAIEQFNESIREDPSYAQAYYNLGNVNYYDLGNFGEARELYEKAEKDLGDRLADLSYNLGYIYYNSMDFEKASGRFLKARQVLNRTDPALNLAIGNTYLQSGRYDLAVSEYLEAVDHYRELYGDYPRVNLASREMTESLKMLSTIYNNLGVSCINLNDEKKALLYFWKAVESAKKLGFSNENTEARVNIQYVLQSKNRIVSEPQAGTEIKKSLLEKPYETIPF